jgi:hypothetical protein
MGIDKKHHQLLSQQNEWKVFSMFSSVSGHPYTGFEILSERLCERIKEKEGQKSLPAHHENE